MTDSRKSIASAPTEATGCVEKKYLGMTSWMCTNG